MFVGHFAMGAMVKPLAPKLPIWALVTAPQLMDLLFIPLALSGVESFIPGDYGHAIIEANYTHSFVGALLIAGFAYWLGTKFWKTRSAGLVLGSLSFSHWVVDVLVHHSDMPWLPGNLGNFEMLGFGLWNFEYAVFATEAMMTLAGLAIYSYWSWTHKSGRYWYAGPIVLAAVFSALVLSDFSTLHAHS